MKIRDLLFFLLFLLVGDNHSMDFKKIDANDALLGAMVVLPIFTNIIYTWSKSREINNLTCEIVKNKKYKENYFGKSFFYASFYAAMPLITFLILNRKNPDIFTSKAFLFTVGGTLLESIIFSGIVNEYLKDKYQDKISEILKNKLQDQHIQMQNVLQEKSPDNQNSNKPLSPDQQDNNQQPIASGGGGGGGSSSKNEQPIISQIEEFQNRIKNIKEYDAFIINGVLLMYIEIKKQESEGAKLDENFFKNWLEKVTITYNIFDYVGDINFLIKTIFSNENKKYLSEDIQDIFKKQFNQWIERYYNNTLELKDIQNSDDVIIAITECLKKIHEGITNEEFKNIALTFFNEKLITSLHDIKVDTIANIMSRMFTYNNNVLSLLNEKTKKLITQMMQQYLSSGATVFFKNFENDTKIERTAKKHFQLIQEYQKLCALCSHLFEDKDFKSECEKIIASVNAVLTRVFRSNFFVFDNNKAADGSSNSQALNCVTLIFNEQNKDFFTQETKDAVKEVIIQECTNNWKFLYIPIYENDIQQYNQRIDEHINMLSAWLSNLYTKAVFIMANTINDINFTYTIKNIVNEKTKNMIECKCYKPKDNKQLAQFVNFMFKSSYYKDFYYNETKKALIEKIVLFAQEKCFIINKENLLNKTFFQCINEIEKIHTNDSNFLNEIIQNINNNEYSQVISNVLSEKITPFNDAIISVISDKIFKDIGEVKEVVAKVFDNDKQTLFNDKTKEIIINKIQQQYNNNSEANKIIEKYNKKALSEKNVA